MRRGRRRRKTKVQKVVNFVKSVIAFFFSHVGLCAVVVGYALLGAFTFRAIEQEHERDVQREVLDARTLAVNSMWNTSKQTNRLEPELWRANVHSYLIEFQGMLFDTIKDGYDGKEYDKAAQWTFTGAFLYSLTVVTTIGYGNTACKTVLGKTVTIIYALVGIPLLLLFLTNIGDVLAKTFKFLYSRSLKLKMRLVLWQKRKKQARLRRANSMVSRVTRASSGSRSQPPGRHRYPDSLSDTYYGSALGGATDFEELIAAREELAKLEAKLAVEEKVANVTVPLSVVIATLLGYLFFGAALFSLWEHWTFIEGIYFCYVSLATIGFGDLFPGASVNSDSQDKLVITSIYLMLGMALLAMSLNLAQEEVVNKVSSLAIKVGIIKPEPEETFT